MMITLIRLVPLSLSLLLLGSLTHEAWAQQEGFSSVIRPRRKPTKAVNIWQLNTTQKEDIMRFHEAAVEQGWISSFIVSLEKINALRKKGGTDGAIRFYHGRRPSSNDLEIIAWQLDQNSQKLADPQASPLLFSENCLCVDFKDNCDYSGINTDGSVKYDPDAPSGVKEMDVVQAREDIGRYVTTGKTDYAFGVTLDTEVLKSFLKTVGDAPYMRVYYAVAKDGTRSVVFLRANTKGEVLNTNVWIQNASGICPDNCD